MSILLCDQLLASESRIYRFYEKKVVKFAIHFVKTQNCGSFWLYLLLFCCSFKIYNNIFQKHLGNPVFRLVAILKSTNNIFEKQLQRNPFLRQVIPNLSVKSLKNTCEEICILESLCVSINKVFGIQLCRNSFFQFNILLVVIVPNATLLKCLTSISINHLLETP